MPSSKLKNLIIALVILISGIYFQTHPKKVAKDPKVSGIKIEYGKAIKVEKAVDGDTVTLINGDSLRYIGIDTPEKLDERKPVQCFAEEASQKNRELVEGKEIKFYKDVTERDKYGRWLGYVYLMDDTFVNLELVKQGYAFAYRYAPDNSKIEEFRAAEEYARTNKLGLWGGECTISKLSSGRKQTNAIETND
jgi:micrococcal nuclease